MKPASLLDPDRDPHALDQWLVRHVPGFRGPYTVLPLSGGQSNPTFRLTAASGAYVIRRKPFGTLLPKAHAVEREYRVQRALAGSGVPVAAVHALCEDPGVIGCAYYVMDFVPGRIFLNIDMPGVGALERRAMFDSMNQTIAALHSLAPQALALQDFGRPDQYLRRQVVRWGEQYRASMTDPITQMDELIPWLAQHLPAERGGRIVHGDFKLDNIVFSPQEPRVLAVLDWELATVGDPLADFAYHLMPWYLELDLFRGWAGLDLKALGIPTQSDYVAAYAARTGLKGPVDWRFYLVFSMFRLAAILQGVLKRGLIGTAADEQAAQVGRRARPVAERAWELACRPAADFEF